MNAFHVDHVITHLGGIETRQHGSHRVYEVSSHGQRYETIVPQHHGDLPDGTLHSIERDLEPALGPGWLYTTHHHLHG
ncbi:MAG: type II toxin-antitoxin system HicA family toxin [Propionibacteriaceae bacterium]|jgi:predicted RNA binding protein YcfA (HicA-like mRNA interferase family)|nr:type II toxin-antitoxin system HicA family toxin [Propionibacteriaceae bacterium]